MLADVQSVLVKHEMFEEFGGGETSKQGQAVETISCQANNVGQFRQALSRCTPFHKTFVSLAVLFVVTVSVLLSTVFRVTECLQNIGLGQYENQDASNHDFCQFFVDLKEFFVGDRLECRNSMLLCCYVLICNQLDSKFSRRA